MRVLERDVRRMLAGYDERQAHVGELQKRPRGILVGDLAAEAILGPANRLRHVIDGDGDVVEGVEAIVGI